MSSDARDSGIGRRAFVRAGVATAIGAASLPLVTRAEQQPPAPGAAPAKDAAPAQPAAPTVQTPAAGGPPRVQRYRRLGRTGLQIADIGFGASRLGSDEKLVQFALERGVNYFDTAESYRGGDSELTLGRALAGKRDQFYLASKVSAQPDDDRAVLMRTLEASLKRLRTDRIDIYFNHAVNDVERLSNPEWAEFATLAKKQGKIRFTGMSGHAGKLIECLDYALDNDLVDVILCGYNFGQDPAFYSRFTRSLDFVAIQPDLPRVIHKAKTKDVGVIAMKTLMGGRLNDMRPYETPQSTFAQAAFRWVLSNPDVDALIVTMNSPEQVEEYLRASGGERVASGDLQLLERYAMLASAEFCRIGCNRCEGACPEGVPIADVLRSRMYAVDYGDLRLARESYGELAVNASACLNCSHVACAGACPYGLQIAQLARQTHATLTGV